MESEDGEGAFVEAHAVQPMRTTDVVAAPSRNVEWLTATVVVYHEAPRKLALSTIRRTERRSLFAHTERTIAGRSMIPRFSAAAPVAIFALSLSACRGRSHDVPVAPEPVPDPPVPVAAPADSPQVRAEDESALREHVVRPLSSASSA
jgi:hypothetical protein